ncbi:MAG: hypothetical protein HN952_03310 [Candidatus Cloacimonetes bacterium]|jgi:thiol-disulfide isomerase/thioredoxin|nr:hypothetical protein [Candidatus Cloacimonadota bacterium]MBT6993965.1 hypothetical protein [Candidatus Cloacimonadota bacterium]MBT7469759.1 hypothetical protein [Candidatus Cloacimonadota bacterium]
MNKIFVLGLIFLSIFACDRFEHKFEPEIVDENYIIDFFTTFADSIETILPTEDVSDIMNFFHNDYSNNGLIKSDVEIFYKAFSYINMPLTFEATIIDTNAFTIDWRLLVTSLDSETTFMDTLMSDVLIETEDSYQFYGNQADMRNVVIELFTGQWCSNCPSAEEALHNLRMQYGSRFSYVEYHVGDQLAGDFADVFGYYPNTGTLPLGIVNGNANIIYSAPSAEEVQTEIETAIIPLLQEPPLISLTDIQTNLTDSLLTGSVQIEVDTAISTNNLTLVAVLMEDYNEEYPNHHGDPHHNIALKRVTIDISALNLDDPVNFEINELDVLPQWYMDNATGLPEDITLVIWVQTLETPYNQNTCTAYNTIEVSLNN